MGAHQRVIRRVLRLCFGVVLLGVLVVGAGRGSTASAHGQRALSYPSCDSNNDFSSIIGRNGSSTTDPQGRTWHLDVYVYGYYRIDTRQFCGLIDDLGVISVTPGSGINNPWLQLNLYTNPPGNGITVTCVMHNGFCAKETAIFPNNGYRTSWGMAIGYLNSGPNQLSANTGTVYG